MNPFSLSHLPRKLPITRRGALDFSLRSKSDDQPAAR